MMKRLAAAVVLLAVSAGPAAACPMCKAANEAPQSESGSAANLKPRAFMYSIFFMMGMPVVAGGIITVALRREIRLAGERDPANGLADGSLG